MFIIDQSHLVILLVHTLYYLPTFLTHFLLIKNKKFSLNTLGFHYTNNCVCFKGEVKMLNFGVKFQYFGRIPTKERNLLDFPDICKFQICGKYVQVKVQIFYSLQLNLLSIQNNSILQIHTHVLQSYGSSSLFQLRTLVLVEGFCKKCWGKAHKYDIRICLLL